MKINCDVVKDLLPQYYDGTLEKDTEKLVKEHLDECDECRSYLDEIIKINEELDRGEVPVAPSMSEIGAATAKSSMASPVISSSSSSSGTGSVSERRA